MENPLSCKMGRLPVYSCGWLHLPCHKSVLRLFQLSTQDLQLNELTEDLGLLARGALCDPPFGSSSSFSFAQPSCSAIGPTSAANFAPLDFGQRVGLELSIVPMQGTSIQPRPQLRVT